MCAVQAAAGLSIEQQAFLACMLREFRERKRQLQQEHRRLLGCMQVHSWVLHMASHLLFPSIQVRLAAKAGCQQAAVCSGACRQAAASRVRRATSRHCPAQAVRASRLPTSRVCSASTEAVRNSDQTSAPRKQLCHNCLRKGCAAQDLAQRQEDADHSPASLHMEGEALAHRLARVSASQRQLEIEHISCCWDNGAAPPL